MRSFEMRRSGIRRCVGVASRTRCRLVRCHATPYQLKICLNKTCKSQGSADILRFVQDLSLKEVEATGCGCLGSCGNGPNMLLLPEELYLSHVSTVAKMTEILETQCGVRVDSDLVLSMQLRISGNMAARLGEFAEAEEKYTRALEITCKGNLHLLYANRSGVRLSNGNVKGALSDAISSIEYSPLSYTTVSSLLFSPNITKNYQKAYEVFEELAMRNPEFKETTDYAVIAKQLRVDLKSKSRV